MRKISLRKNKTLLVVVKIVVFLIVSMVMDYFILPAEFLRIEYTAEMFEKYVNNELLSVTEWLNRVWNNNIYMLSYFVFQVIILLLFGFRLRKAENFRLSRHTVVIVLSCLVLASIGYSYKLHYEFLNYGLRWQTSIADLFRYFVAVAMVEEILYRSFITNELFQLKQNGLKTPVAIAISAVVFGFIHIDVDIIYFFRYGVVPSISVILERFIAPALFGVSWAVVLYYRKDIVALICIHAVNNILFDSYTYTSNPALGALYVIFVIVFAVGYPVYLIFKARTEAKALDVEIV